MGGEFAPEVYGMRHSLLVLSVLAAFAGCSKGQNQASAAATANAAAANPASASDGAAIYITNCSSCHQPDGKGLAGAFPPLAGNPLVTGDPIAVITIVKDGLNGSVAVGGHAYGGIMPAWGAVLGDEQIAAVITYLRGAWHNHAGGVSAAQVAAVK